MNRAMRILILRALEIYAREVDSPHMDETVEWVVNFPPTIYACNNGDCGWLGVEAETVHPKHDSSRRLCADCYETTYVATVAGLWEGDS